MKKSQKNLKNENKYVNILKNITNKNGVKYNQTNQIITDFLNQISIGLIENKTIKIPKFGQLIPKTCKTRNGINPATLEKIQIPEKRIIRFKASSTLKQSMNV